MDGDLYIVDAILDKRTQRLKGGKSNQRAVHYLCHWKGYSSDFDTWEPLVNIPAQSREMVNEFNAKLRVESKTTAASSNSIASVANGKRKAKEL